MQVQLRPELQKFVDHKVSSGEYGSAEELLEAAIARLMLDPEPQLDEETLQAIEEGEAQADRGEEVPWEAVKAKLVAKYLPK